jgi:hypothetical protein
VDRMAQPGVLDYSETRPATFLAQLWKEAAQC